jgi:dTDP-4-amino-4,6-dideoxygalactose transaminase
MKINVGDFRIGQPEKDAIMEVLDSGRLSEGAKTRKFEQMWAEFVGTRYSVAVNSGTSALIVGLTAYKYSDFCYNSPKKIITTPLTYIATSNAIVHTGFEPEYVDIDPETFGITPDNIKAHLEKVNDIEKYALILPVHLMGYPCRMDEINKIAHKYGIETFEDSAQAHGTVYRGEKTGSFGLLSDFSFYIAHNIQVGEMGAVNTSDIELMKLVKSIKANGRMCNCPVCKRSEGKCPNISSDDSDNDPRFTHNYIGYNFKTLEFQAALGITQLEKVDWITQRRSENVKYLNDNLESLFGEKHLTIPKYDKNVSYLAYPIIITPWAVKNGITRKKLRATLEKKGIETRPLFGSIPTQQPAYSYMKKKYEDKLPNADYIGENGFYIGCHQYLQQTELDYIINTFKEIL